MPNSALRVRDFARIVRGEAIVPALQFGHALG